MTQTKLNTMNTKVRCDTMAPSYRDNVQITNSQVDNSDQMALSYRDNIQITHGQVDNSDSMYSSVI